MTPEDVKTFLPKLIAFAERKTIQIQDNDGKWYDLSEGEGHMIIYSHARCRIKPEPSHSWYELRHSGLLIGVGPTIEEAKHTQANHPDERFRTVKADLYHVEKCNDAPGPTREPREFYVNVHGTDNPPSSQCWFRIYSTRGEADASDWNNDGNRVECIHVREVLD